MHGWTDKSAASFGLTGAQMQLKLAMDMFGTDMKKFILNSTTLYNYIELDSKESFKRSPLKYFEPAPALEANYLLSYIQFSKPEIHCHKAITLGSPRKAFYVNEIHHSIRFDESITRLYTAGIVLFYSRYLSGVVPEHYRWLLQRYKRDGLDVDAIFKRMMRKEKHEAHALNLYSKILLPFVTLFGTQVIFCIPCCLFEVVFRLCVGREIIPT